MSFKGFMKKVGASIYHHRADIEFFIGVGLTVGGAAWTIIKAPEAAEVHERARCMKDVIDENDAENSWDNEAVTRKEAVRTMAKSTIKGYTKVYAGPVAMMVAGEVLKAVSHATMHKELGNVSALLASTSLAFSQYRQRVVEDQGEEKDQEYLFGPAINTYKKNPDGTITQTLEPIQNSWEDVKLPPHCMIFDAGNRNYDESPYKNYDFLVGHLRWLNERLDAEEFLFENDIRKDLQMPLVKCGYTSGILKYDENGNRNYLSFGLDARNEATQRFRDGLEPTVIIQMNLEDDIMSKLHLALS